MKKSELKQILKPLIKECIKEVIFEEGVLSNIVSEVAQGLGGRTIITSKQDVAQTTQQSIDNEHEAERTRQKLHETRKRMLDVIGNDSYNGVDIFEGTSPSSHEPDQTSPLSGMNPSDPGVDVSQLFGGANKNWSRMIK